MQNNLYAMMVSLGYKTVTEETAMVQCDREQAESMRCKLCGGQCFYDGYYQYTMHSYRAFAVCNECGKFEEL